MSDCRGRRSYGAGGRVADPLQPPPLGGGGGWPASVLGSSGLILGPASPHDAVMAVPLPRPHHAKAVGLSSLGGEDDRRKSMTSVATLLRIPKEFSDAHSFDVGILLPGRCRGALGLALTALPGRWAGCRLSPWVTCPRCNSLSGVWLPVNSDLHTCAHVCGYLQEKSATLSSTTSPLLPFFFF